MKIVSIVGARPQFIKDAMLSRAVRKYNAQRSSAQKLKKVLIHTGQHYDYNMSQVFFDELNLKDPNYNLGIGSFSQGKQTGLMLDKIEETLLKEKPDMVVVYGDTNSTLAGALAAAKLNLPIAHVEAGLRSFNRNMPEEINRIVTDEVSKILFCPTGQAITNLEHEGIRNGDIIKGLGTRIVAKVGDIMFDLLLYYKDIARKRSKILQKLNINSKGYLLCTVHRAENTDDISRLKSIVAALERLSEDFQVILPIHPRTKNLIKKHNLKVRKVKIIESVSYIDMVKLEQEAAIILTDSGGVQKEAYFLKVPCLVLRDETEWVETVKIGWNYLAGANTNKIVDTIDKIRRIDFANKKYPYFYGDGNSADKMLKVILKEIKA